MWIYIVLIVTTSLVLYLGFRLINPASVPVRWKVTAWITLAVLLYGHQLSWFLRRRGDLPGMPQSLLDWVGFSAFGLVSIVAVAMLARDVPLCVVRSVAAVRRLFVRRSRRPYFTGPNLERRRFLLNATNSAMLAVALPATGYGMLAARARPTVIRNDLPVAGLPSGLDGFTIVQVSDTHAGPTIGREWTRMVVDEVMSLGGDMIVHTGDMVDGTVDGLADAVAPWADLAAPHGVWFCTGNHEYYSGVVPWLDKIRALGLVPLNNEHAVIDTGQGTILLGGVTDIRGGQVYPPHVSSPQAAMAGAPAHDVSILLAHQPKSVFEASRAGFDIQLSGHTHGGQYFPYTWAIHLFQPYVRGLHLHENTLLYVNTGTGYWGPPLRLGTVPEVTLHTLRRG